MYFLYYQRRYGDTVVIAQSTSLLKLLKIKKVTFNYNTRASITNERLREEFNKFDLSINDLEVFNDFCMKVNSGRYYRTYDYTLKL